MSVYRNLKRYGSMVAMIVMNLFIFMLLFASLLHYNSEYKHSMGDKNLDEIQHIINSTSITVQSVLDVRNDKIQDIRYYAQKHDITVNELIEYIVGSTSGLSHNLQIVDEDLNGYQILFNPYTPYRSVSYADCPDINLKSIFLSRSESVTNYMQYTPEFINPYDGQRTIALYTKFNLSTKDGEKSYTLLSTSTVDNLLRLLNYQSSVEGLQIILCDNYGNYIVNYEGFENRNFFSYIALNNHMSEIARYDLHTRIFDTKQGQLTYRNNKNKETLYTYNRIQESSWFTVGSIPVSKLYEDIDVSNLAIRVALVLLAVLAADLVWMSIIKKRLEESMNTQQQQTAIIEAALQEAQSANMAKTSFLNNISHDIRTPMNAVIGFTSLAQANLDDKWMIKDYLDKIMTSSKHLLSIINEVLDMSRIENGKVKVSESRINLQELLDNLFKILQPSLRAKRLSFQMETSSLNHLNVLCDRNKVEQVLLNILSNAIKFTLEGSIITVIANENKSHKKGYGSYEFIVKDRGIGISPDFLPHVFEPFEKERYGDNSDNEGSGLGLAITKSYVDMMDGTISVVSKKNAGTTVTIKLKFRLADEEEEKAVKITEEAASAN